MSFIQKSAALAQAIVLASGMAAIAGSPAENKDAAIAYYDALYSGGDTSGFIAGGYVEHQQGSGFTREGMRAIALASPVENTVHRILAEGDLVFLHVEQQRETTFARGELFRFNDAGMITEHWASTQAAVPASETKSGNSMFDGVTEVKADSTLAADFAAAHLEATNKIFNNADSDAVFASVTAGYIQHNPGGPNGPEGLAGTVQYLKGQGIELEKQLYQTVSEGDFMVKLNFYGTTPRIPDFGQALVFDIIRFAEDGRAAEHWDVAEEIEEISERDDLF